ncbi:hypothetical protein F5148DRAFT_1229087 [Russula earlei]|uniref:Uncharacterized protein n=1 Tax=Russula earlei TaxID=71964 RepID=A0ACC0U117_9AGAM|nr:hypothetical protein F5148DRAFT_1229087 [Russula earlei]
MSNGEVARTVDVATQLRSHQLSGEITHEDELMSLADVVDDVQNTHELLTAPLLTRGAYRIKNVQQAVAQYGAFGTIVESRLSVAKSNIITPDEDSTRLYLNTNAPFSAVICGVQGSGKSHTTAVILENMFVAGCRALGRLVRPLSGLVLHVGETGDCAAPCEAAYVSVSVIDNAVPPPVRVYVAPSSLTRMKKVYSHLGDNLEVKPLYFSERELDAPAFLSLMAVNSSDHAPLYMQTVLSVLRELGDNYTYDAFMTKLEDRKRDMNPGQKAGLRQRLELLQTNSPNAADTKEEKRFAPAMVTIIDLSDPFVDPTMAGAIFEICIRLFQRANVDTGKVLIVDEAHKYLSEANASTGLTQTLLSLVRQQRHLSMRVIVSTQEPTVLPSAFLALCSVMILHRFASPSWWEHLKKHISAKMSSDDAFDRVVKLKTGDALISCPTGLYASRTKGSEESGTDGSSTRLMHFSRNFIVVRTRKRVTADGGASLLAV